MTSDERRIGGERRAVGGRACSDERAKEKNELGHEKNSVAESEAHEQARTSCTAVGNDKNDNGSTRNDEDGTGPAIIEGDRRVTSERSEQKRSGASRRSTGRLSRWKPVPTVRRSEVSGRAVEIVRVR